MSKNENPITLNKSNVIDDFIFICYLMGNDFLPHIPALDIYSNAIDKIDKTKKTKYFLRIDNEKDLEYYKNKYYPNYQTSITRSKDNIEDSLHVSNNKYLLLDDLENTYLEVALLSVSDILVHCVSNMATASLYMNMNQKSICVSKN